MDSPDVYGECKRGLSDRAAARLAVLCKVKPPKAKLPKLKEVPDLGSDFRLAQLPSCDSPLKSKYLLQQGEQVYYEKHMDCGAGVRWLFNRRNGRFRKQELLSKSVENRLLHKFGHRPTGQIHLKNLSNPVTDNFTEAAPFYKPISLPVLSPHQFNEFTKSTSRFLERVYAKRAMKVAAAVAMQAWLLAETVLDQLSAIEEEIVMAKLRNVQIELDKRVGSSCPDIKVEVMQKKIILLDTINFEGGKAQIKVEDMHVCNQLCRIITFLYEIMGDEEMIHVRIDGHVHDTGKPDKCLIISYFRAAEIARNLAKYVPKKFIHSFGYGGTKPVSKIDTSLNRRVEISLLVSEKAVLDCCTSGCELWGKIIQLKECEKLLADPKFAGDPNVSVPLRMYEPNDPSKIFGEEAPALDPEAPPRPELSESSSAPVLR